MTTEKGGRPQGYQMSRESRERMSETKKQQNLAGLAWYEVWEIISGHLQKGDTDKASAVLNAFMSARHPHMRATIYNMAPGRRA